MHTNGEVRKDRKPAADNGAKAVRAPKKDDKQVVQGKKQDVREPGTGSVRLLADTTSVWAKASGKKYSDMVRQNAEKGHAAEAQATDASYSHEAEDVPTSLPLTVPQTRAEGKVDHHAATHHPSQSLTVSQLLKSEFTCGTFTPYSVHPPSGVPVGIGYSSQETAVLLPEQFAHVAYQIHSSEEAHASNTPAAEATEGGASHDFSSEPKAAKATLSINAQSFVPLNSNPPDWRPNYDNYGQGAYYGGYPAGYGGYDVNAAWSAEGQPFNARAGAGAGAGFGNGTYSNNRGRRGGGAGAEAQKPQANRNHHNGQQNFRGPYNGPFPPSYGYGYSYGYTGAPGWGAAGQAWPYDRYPSAGPFAGAGTAGAPATAPRSLTAESANAQAWVPPSSGTETTQQPL